MTNTALLPLRPLPKPLESTIGYLLRLGAANGFGPLYWLKAYCKQHGLSQQSFDSFFFAVTAHAPDALQNLWGPSNSTLKTAPGKALGIKSLYWNLHHRRWCPDCLREYGYWKAEWLLTLQVGCPTHQRLLLETCPGCAAPIGWHQGELLQCRCGQILTYGSITPLPHLLQLLSMSIAEKFAETCSGQLLLNTATDPFTDLFAELHLSRLMDLLWSLGSYVRSTKSERQSRKISDHNDLQVVIPILECATEVLLDWPHAFHRWLAGAVDSSKSNDKNLRSYLGWDLHTLGAMCRHPELHFIRLEFERFIGQNWHGVITDRHQFLSLMDEPDPQIITAQEAAARMQVSRKKIAVLVTQQTIRGWYLQTPGSRRYLVVDRVSLENHMAGEHGRLFNLQQAANYLGLGPSRVRDLYKIGLLHPIHRPVQGDAGHAHWIFEQHDLDHLLGDLSLEPHPTPDCQSLIALGDALLRMMGIWPNMVQLVDAMRSGALPVAGRDPGRGRFSGILLNRQDLTSWLHKHGLQHRMQLPLRLAGQYLGMLQSQISWVFHQGLLPGKTSSACPRYFELDKADLDQFRSKYIWGSELSTLTGQAKNAASRYLRKAGIQPVSGPTVDSGKLFLFRRADVLQYLEQQRSEIK